MFPHNNFALIQDSQGGRMPPAFKLLSWNMGLLVNINTFTTSRRNLPPAATLAFNFGGKMFLVFDELAKALISVSTKGIHNKLLLNSMPLHKHTRVLLLLTSPNSNFGAHPKTILALCGAGSHV